MSLKRRGENGRFLAKKLLLIAWYAPSFRSVAEWVGLLRSLSLCELTLPGQGFGGAAVALNCSAGHRTLFRQAQPSRECPF